jgi:hypothetical protein
LWDDSDAGRFAVLLEPIAADKLGKALVSGVCQARINVTNEAHRRAEAAPQPDRLF